MLEVQGLWASNLRAGFRYSLGVASRTEEEPNQSSGMEQLQRERACRTEVEQNPRGEPVQRQVRARRTEAEQSPFSETVQPRLLGEEVLLGEAAPSPIVPMGQAFLQAQGHLCWVQEPQRRREVAYLAE
jgi:hypothetical protein